MFIQEDYVSLETAKILKEKGFDEPTAGFYGSKRGLCIGGSLLYNSINNRVNFVNDLLKVQFEDVIAAAPTLYEAQKWIRDRHNLHIDVGLYGDYSTDADGNKVDEHQYWAFDIYYTTNIINHIFDCEGGYDTYEQALDAGIREALKLI